MKKLIKLVKKHMWLILSLVLLVSCLTGSLHTFIALAKNKLGLGERQPASK